MNLEKDAITTHATPPPAFLAFQLENVAEERGTSHREQRRRDFFLVLSGKSCYLLLRGLCYDDVPIH